ncbi:MAG: DUF423 domain-containing protein [Planctomycetota bacterium]
MPNMITVSAVVGLLGVALGAFGAHGLESQLQATPEQLEWWRTATLYHLLHVVPLLAIGVLQEQRPGGNRAALLFLLGILLFSGSLYAMGLGAPRTLGAVTPFGGLALIAGWALLAFYGARGVRAGGT